MRSTVVPAQITTVEDRIAGSLTFPQIILLVLALIAGATIYGVIPPKVHLSTVKLILIISQFMFFGLLALRVNGRILIDWAVIYLRFKARPHIYIFSKNDLTSREIIVEDKKMSNQIEVLNEDIATSKPKTLSLAEEMSFDKILKNRDLSISFKSSKKGGIDVSLKQI